MRLKLIAALVAATITASAAEYTQTSCRLRMVEGQWANMSGFTHHLNVSHAHQPGGKVSVEVSKYANDGTGWTLEEWWDELYAPNDLQIGWFATDIEDGNSLAYIVRVWFGNGLVGYQPTSGGNTMFTMSLRPNTMPDWWNETAVAPPPASAAWADYRISAYGQWVAGVALVGWGSGFTPAPVISVSAPPPGYFN